MVAAAAPIQPRRERWERLSADQKHDEAADDLDGHDRDLVRIESKIDRLTNAVYGLIAGASMAVLLLAVNLIVGTFQ